MRMNCTSWSRRLAVIGVLAAVAMIGAGTDAQARVSGKGAHTRAVRSIHGADYRPPYADIVIDETTSQVLHESDPDAPRHPASLTKIMTLYLLFEQLEEGKLKLDTPLAVSAHASVQPPTKLGLKPNATIAVEDAIKGLVTKSANDAAAVVGEAIGGSEEEFAKLMTAKARELGMGSTTYVNASGLPADEQITTARDQALLASAIQHRFPVYYRYFATPSFVYHGAEMRNHNMLLGQVKGVDGIKTGYTEASGYNLVSSVRRDNKHLIAVVLGGTSNAARDARMRQLIEDNINLCTAGPATNADTDTPAPAAAPAAALAPVHAPAKLNTARAKPAGKDKPAPQQAGQSPAQPSPRAGTRQVAAAKTPQLQPRRDPLKSSATLVGRKPTPAPAR